MRARWMIAACAVAGLAIGAAMGLRGFAGRRGTAEKASIDVASGAAGKETVEVPAPAGPRCGDDLDTAPVLERIIDQQASPCDLQALDTLIAARYAQPGPWNQDVHVARSIEGSRFAPAGKAPVLTTAAVPEVVRGDDGRHYLFYVDGDLERLRRLARDHAPWFRTHGLPGIGAIDLAVSDDGLRFAPVLEFGVEGLVRGMVVDPDVVRLPDGRWRMYYVGMPVPEFVRSSWRTGEHHSVFSAISGDLVHWHQEGEVVRGPYADPSVVCGRQLGAAKYGPLPCIMASFGLDWSTSRDGGRTFEYQGSASIPGFAPELMVRDDGSIRMIYNEKAGGAPISARVSKDGVAWTPTEADLLEGYGEAPTLARAPDGGWLLYYHSFKSADDIPSRIDGLSPRQRAARDAGLKPERHEPSEPGQSEAQREPHDAGASAQNPGGR